MGVIKKTAKFLAILVLVLLLIVFAASPPTDLASLNAPSAVIKNAQWLGPQELQQLKDSAETPSNAYLTFGRLLEFVTPW